jgi:hypothetical protein
MTEKEVEVVMEGQEDGKGCINYEGAAIDYFVQCAVGTYCSYIFCFYRSISAFVKHIMSG